MSTLGRIFFLASLAACGASSSTGTDGAPGAAASGPYPITCKVFRRIGSGPFTEARVEHSSDVDGTKSDDATGVRFETSLEAVPGTADDALFRVSVPASKVTHEVRVRRRERPPFQYIGDHGFVGLGYLRPDGADVQYICTAGDGPVGGAEPVATPLPIRVRCTVQGPNGDVQTLELDGPGDKKLEFAGTFVGGTVFDDQFEGRALLFAIGDESVPRGETFHSKQLLQLSRERRLVNLFGPEHGFTGKVSVTLPSGGVVSYACATP
jgi:hypothetical protein